jgi:alkylated DNA repair dioxygenase AlkB
MIKIIENFVDEEFEKKVLELIKPKKQITKDRNQVLRYGSSNPYPSNMISKIIPDIFLTIKDIEFDSVTINEYNPGQHIDWHIDKPYAGKDINIISLLSDGNLKFRKDSEEKSFLLKKNSLAIISDDLRYKWQHSFLAEAYRVSVVLRNSNYKYEC